MLPKQAATEPAPAAARAQAPTQAGDGGAQLALPPRAQAWRPRKRASSARAPGVRHLPGCGIPDELRLKRYPRRSLVRGYPP